MERIDSATTPSAPLLAPSRTELIFNGPDAAASETCAALIRSAYSPNVKERADCSTAVCDTEERTLALATHAPRHLGSTLRFLLAILSPLPLESLWPDNLFLTYDPILCRRRDPSEQLHRRHGAAPGRRLSVAVLLQYRADRVAVWRQALEAALPGETVRVWPDTGPPEEIELIVTMAPQPGSLAGFPNLRFVAATGAGVERLLDPACALPPGVPVVRLVDGALAEGMAEYVLAAVLADHREFQAYEQARRTKRWQPLPRIEATDRTVGILGLGELGRAAARRLWANGFRLLGWSRTTKEVEGVECFAGPDARLSARDGRG